ncbi:MAG: membrane-associated protein [Candidatus Binatia bacterium]
MRAISLWIKIPYTLFVAVLVPVYWVQYGPQNFLWFSDVALLVTLAALWLESRFLASMAASGTLLLDTVWNLFFFPKLIVGAGPGGLVGYMFDPEISFYVRALSLFHVALPVIQLWALYKLGYDARAWKYQAVLGCMLLLLAYRLSELKENVNWVFGIIDVPQTWMPPGAYLGLLLIIYPLGVCFPTHLILKRFFHKQKPLDTRFRGYDGGEATD